MADLYKTGETVILSLYVVNVMYRRWTRLQPLYVVVERRLPRAYQQA